MSEYQRYRIETEQTPNRAEHPSRFRVQMNRPRLASFLLKELFHYRGDLEIILSRPCVYGVFSGPVGGFAPRDNLCVGCLRCTVQYPDMVQIVPNPDRLKLGDSFLTPGQVDTILYEATTGRVPVKGAGYRGAYGGDGWDAMWTDMSEIVRPTRDGIHGREYISTAVDIGPREQYLEFDDGGHLMNGSGHVISLPVPMLFDVPPRAAQKESYLQALAAAAFEIQSLVVLPFQLIKEHGLQGEQIVPLVDADEIEGLSQLDWSPRLIEVDSTDADLYLQLTETLPDSIICLRFPFGEADIVDLAEAGVGCFHLVADYHGHTSRGFVMEAIREAHQSLVEAGLREQVTLMGSGGIAAAEHTPKAIISGLDAVAIETAPLVAVQSEFRGEVVQSDSAQLALTDWPVEWGRQRLVNMIASWRDQLLEILGAMGLREVRRLRGEMGRSMRQADLEREAFAGIEGFDHD